MKLIFFISFFCLTLPHTAPACDCINNGPFTSMAKKVAVVALVKVTRYLSFKEINGTMMPQSMELKIVEQYKGRDRRKTVVVWGDNGALCRPYLDTFKKDNYYVMALDYCKKMRGGPDEKDTDLYVDACGTYWLSINQKRWTARGDIDGKKRVIKLGDLKKLL